MRGLVRAITTLLALAMTGGPGGAPTEVMYVFVWDDLGWRIDDIAGPEGAVSDMICQPKRPRPDWIRGSGYCYATEPLIW